MQATVLSIAGSDPTGGAGIQADLKTMTSIGVYGAAAVTCITIQNSRGVTEVECLPPGLVHGQIKAVLDDHRVTHVKIGMVGNTAIAGAVRDALAGFRGEIIYDPVMLSSTGQPLLQGDMQGILELAARCTVLTPNIPELAQLSGAKIVGGQDVRHHAGLLLERYRSLRGVLVKGGHAVRDTAIADHLIYRADGAVRTMTLSHPAIKSGNTHGTGCTLASAFASFHCLGGDYVRSFQQSVDYVQTVLKQSAETRIVRNPEGQGGMLHHCYRPGHENS
ncbi:MAG: bifunctional hydroxymethylpyrimidine kinase/phosphomethylpyrimidine kinase [Desulfobulbaceae bacterium]|nr:bifunctional hydroxymethylpyrimidine kinase/phosphomethylpyrimidine kinase [Desulfobulbaceae bacterium]